MVGGGVARYRLFPAAEQAVDRLLEQTPGQIPQRHVDCSCPYAGLLPLGALDLVVDELALQGVPSFQERPDPRQHSLVKRREVRTESGYTDVCVHQQHRAAGRLHSAFFVDKIESVIIGAEVAFLIAERNGFELGDARICHWCAPLESCSLLSDRSRGSRRGFNVRMIGASEIRGKRARRSA